MKIYIYLTFSAFLISTYTSYSQERYLEVLTSDQIDSLAQVYPLIKGTPERYQSSIYIAIQAFPELKDSEINIKEKKLITTMNAQPTVGSLFFRKRTNRKYVIRINKLEKDSVIHFSNVPHNGQVGVFAHEMNHFCDYQTKSFFGVIGRLFALLGKESRGKYEKSIDLKTIEKGFGWQLYDWTRYVFEESNATIKYKAFKRKHYLTPEEVKNIMESHR